MATRVLIADDHPFVADALATGIEGKKIQVVGRTTVAGEVLDKFTEVRPDVVVLDVRFGQRATNTGLDIARALLTAHPEARIVFYSQFDQDEIIREAYRIGASAFLPKSTPLQIVADVIVRVPSEKVVLLPAVAERIAMLSIRGDESPRSLLEARELEVFRLMATGLTNVEIAEQLDLSAKTISTISQTIKDKLKVSRPADVTLLAVRHGVISP